MWGDNDWRERVMSEVEYQMKDGKFDTIVAAQGLLDIAQYMMSRSYNRDEVMKKLYLDAKEAARKELLEKLNK